MKRVTPTPSGRDPVAEEAEIRDLLRTAGRRPELSKEDLDGIKVVARAEWTELVRARRRQPTTRGLALAASLILIVLLAWGWIANQGGRPPVSESLVATVEMMKGEVWVERDIDGDRRERTSLDIGDELRVGSTVQTIAGKAESVSLIALRMASGESVRVDTGTQLALVSGSRLELRHGAVYVDTARAEPGSAPLAIGTDRGDIHHVGTQYEVRLEGPEEPLCLRVREGRVSLQTSGNSLSIGGGEELALALDGSAVRRSIQAHGPEWNWVVAVAPSLEIEGRSLDSFLDWVSQETGWRVLYADESLAESASEVMLHGAITGLTPVESLDAVLPGSGLGYRIEGGDLLISRQAKTRS